MSPQPMSPREYQYLQQAAAARASHPATPVSPAIQYVSFSSSVVLFKSIPNVVLGCMHMATPTPPTLTPLTQQHPHLNINKLPWSHSML